MGRLRLHQVAELSCSPKLAKNEPLVAKKMQIQRIGHANEQTES